MIPSTIQARITKIGPEREQIFEVLSDRRVVIGYTILPVVLLFSFVLVFPILWAIVGGFHAIPPYGGSWDWIGIEHYRWLAESDAFWASMWRAVVFTVGSLAVQIPAGVGLALLITGDFRFNRVIRALAFVPYLIPTVVFGYIAIWMVHLQHGIVNLTLIDLGVVSSGIPFFGREGFVMPSVILTGSWKFTVFVTVMVVARMQSIPDSHYEAAEMMGAGVWRKFRDITLPSIAGVLFIVILLRFVWMFIKFDIIWILTKGGPNDVVLTAPLYAYETAFVFGNLGRAAAISTILFAILVVFAIVYFRVAEPSKEVRTE